MFRAREYFLLPGGEPLRPPSMTCPKCSLLVVDDEPYILTTLAALLAQEFEVLTANSAEAAKDTFARRPVDLILTDQRMPYTTGVQLLAWVRVHSPKTMRLLMTGYGELEDAVDAINRGQVYRYLFKPWKPDELLSILKDACRTFHLEQSNDRLVQELRRLNQELEQRVQDRTQELEEANHLLQQRNLMLEKLALTDPLTGLPNRRAVDRLVESEIRRRARYPSPLALGLLDADHFKEINNRFLHPGGDQVLIELGRTISGSLRAVDTVARIGGEEFLIVAPETNLEGAGTLGERIRADVEQSTYRYNNRPIQVTVSIGFAVAESGARPDYDQFKHLAAEALAEAKTSGRNRCVVRAMPTSSV
jgi:diguanylate cyclase (GGDEF)-like protein